MKALSIRQPWAWLIIKNFKDVENRIQDFPWKFTGEMAVHTGKKPADDFENLRIEIQKKFKIDIPRLQDLPLGAIIGTTHVHGSVIVPYGCHDPREIYPSDWLTGPVGYVLSGSKQFLKPISWKGQQGLFDIPDEIIKRAA